MRSWITRGVLASGLVLAFGAGTACLGTNVTWTGSGGTKSWNTAANWSLNQTPASTNTYTIGGASGASTTLDADFAIQKFTYGLSSSGSLDGGLGSPHTLTLNNGAGARCSKPIPADLPT